MSSTTGERWILVAGGTKGIGRAIALRLAAPGAHIFLGYHADDGAARTALDQVRERGATPHLIKQDVGTAEGAAATIERVASVTDRLDVLVHCSAVPNPGFLAEQPLAELLQAIHVGGLALLYLVQPALKLLREGSSVIFLSGAAVDLVLPRHGALASAKALGECLVRYLAIELAPRGINFNTLRSGPVDTGLLRGARAASGGETAFPPPTPTGHRLTVEEVAETVAFLVSPAGAMIRGQTVVVDGGLGKTVRTS